MPPRWTSIASATARTTSRSEEHTSELQSQSNLVCRPLLEKKNALMPANDRLFARTRHWCAGRDHPGTRTTPLFHPPIPRYTLTAFISSQATVRHVQGQSP